MPLTSADREFYLIVARCESGLYSVERELSKMTEQQVAADIASGQITDVHSVLKFHPVEKWSQDVSEDIARLVLAEHLDGYGSPQPWIMEFLEHHLGCAAVATATRDWAA